MVEQLASGEPVSQGRRLDLPLVARRSAGRDFVRLVLDAPPDWSSMPGQFLNVRCESDAAAARASEGRILDDSDGAEWPRTTGLDLARRRPLVRRPFSISRVVRTGGRVRLELLVRQVGPGTQFLATRPLGATIDVVGPLGNFFTPPADDRLCILLGGGCGMAPIFGLADYLAAAGRRCLCFIGAATAADLPVTLRGRPEATRQHVSVTSSVAELAEAGVAAVLATDDGTAGYHGTVVAALRQYLADLHDGRPAALYGCGPTPMLRQVCEVAADCGWPAQVSLEVFMGCGVGLCLSCVHRRRDPAAQKGWTLRLTCREGPVVAAADLAWD